MELGRNLQKLASYAKATGGQVDPALQSWVTSLPPSLLEKLAKIGLVKSDRVAVNKPLLEHLDDFAKALAAKGNTEKHVRHTRNRIERVFNGCSFIYWDDISASKVQAFLDDLRKPSKQGDTIVPGISAQTFNYYLGSLKAFCRWMVKDRRALASPLSHQQIHVAPQRRIALRQRVDEFRTRRRRRLKRPRHNRPDLLESSGVHHQPLPIAAAATPAPPQSPTAPSATSRPAPARSPPPPSPDRSASR